MDICVCFLAGANIALVGIPLSLRASLSSLQSHGTIYSMNLNNSLTRNYTEIAKPFERPKWDQTRMAGPTFGSSVSLGRTPDGKHESRTLGPYEQRGRARFEARMLC